MKNLKGGVWTNVEDEILKVAVMKYGRNQWARISSLLVRKTPKQCKARWNEWLDPRIKKTEWSREEDEQLLHLAKVFPSQWGTISDLVGRTPQLCLERYERLLDSAQEQVDEEGGEGNDGGKATLSDARKLRPGEIDPDPESKPARPDPVDMDEDEKEMLAEARARLANTQGKKAKRKAREKLLDEARRMAALQKRKELVAAGLPGINFKHRGMDYNNEVPFERKPVPGFYDIKDELAEEESQREEISMDSKVTIQNKDVVELTERKKDVAKQKARAEKGFLPLSLEKKLQEQQAARKTELSLPSPQITDTELEQISKFGIPSTSMDGSFTPLRTPLTNRGFGTPSSSSQIGRTPFRDQLGINASVRENYHEPMESSLLQSRLKLRESFKNLPKPKNDFDIVINDQDHQDDQG